MRYFIFLLVLLTQATLVYSKEYPQAHSKDYRLRNADYDMNQVYVLKTGVGFGTYLLLQEGEELDDWWSGDPDAWDVLNHKNIITVKPKVQQSRSNLIIYTNKGRVYTFSIYIEKDPYYGIRFSYPEDERKKAEALAEKKRIDEALEASIKPDAEGYKNYAYIASGDETIQPTRVYDSGTHTFFYFEEGQDLPAIFRNTADGEKLTQKTTKDNWLIVPHVEKEWMLRLGELVTCIRNDNYKYEKTNHTSTSSEEVYLKTRPIIDKEDSDV